jgi:hypothetical protein
MIVRSIPPLARREGTTRVSPWPPEGFRPIDGRSQLVPTCANEKTGLMTVRSMHCAASVIDQSAVGMGTEDWPMGDRHLRHRVSPNFKSGGTEGPLDGGFQ